MRSKLATVVVLSLGLALPGSAQQSPPQAPETVRLALIVGVSDYDRDRNALLAAGYRVPKSLANAVDDARLVADAFEQQGFKVVRVTNPDRAQLKTSVDAFAAEIAVHANRFVNDRTRTEPDVIAVVYFSGHGAQGRPTGERDIDNYLIPNGARLKDETDLQFEAIGLAYLTERLAPGCCGALVIFVDACRDFALPQPTRGFESRGLAEAYGSSGTLIAYATGSGKTATDGPPGQNGPYARALAAEIRNAAGTSLDDILRSVVRAVEDETAGKPGVEKQTPWISGSLRRQVTIGQPVSAAAAAIDRTILSPPMANVSLREKLRSDANWQEFQGSFYRLTPEKMPFQEARSWARSRGGDLVSITSEAEQRFLISAFGDKRPLWLGLSDEEEEGTWRWLNGEPLGYQAWRPGEPSGRMILGSFGSRENFAAIVDFAGVLSGKDGEWTDVSPEAMRLIGNAYGIVEVRP